MNTMHPDFQAGKEGITHYYPTDAEAYRQGVAEREGTNRPAPNWGGGGAAGGGGGFIIIGLMLLPLMLIGSLFVGVTFPIAGLLAVLGAYLLEVSFVHLNGMGDLLILGCACIAIFMVTMKLERRAEELAWYRLVRHIIRIVGFAVLGHYCVLFLSAFQQEAMANPSTFTMILMDLGIMVGTHFGSRWLDNRR